MGQHDVRGIRRGDELRSFTQSVLSDLQALGQMLERGMIESGVRRVGAEQEMALVSANGRPAAVSTAVLEALDDPRLTTELALFNLEANLPPQRLEGSFLHRLEDELRDVVEQVGKAAEAHGAKILLTGILPTLSQEDLSLRNITPLPRYRQLNEALLALGEGHFSIYLRGVDELELHPDNVMFEAANTSFQLHLQVAAEDFARLYNLAQLITAPLLAAATNSPTLLGKRLWHETRVGLFERSVDARSDAARARGHAPRVSFGSGWVRDSALELFQDAAARFPVMLVGEPGPSPLAQVEDGIAPKLSALMLHNGTVWRWNRPCYGVAEGVAHLRIENRVLPAGPTVLDEVANAALFYGLMLGLDGLSGTIPSRLSFDAAKGNFVQAARQGLGARFTWLDGRRIGARQLLLEELIPAAREALAAAEVPPPDLERYLGTVEERVRSRGTGTRWILSALACQQAGASPEQRTARLTRAMLRLQQSGEPVHRWPPLEATGDGAAWSPRTVADIMSTDLFTVRPDDVVDLATSLMDWQHFRHVPVETAEGKLVGLVSHRALLRLEQRRAAAEASEPMAVEAIMDRQLTQIAPDTPWTQAMQQLLEGNGGCLLVVSGEQLVGIVTERDFLRATATWLEPSNGVVRHEPS